MSARSPSPYLGLHPYGEADALFFFGRERERRLVSANLLASRFTLVYGPSGVGKSSLLSAGVAHHLRQEAEQNLRDTGNPEFVLAVVAAWYEDPSLLVARAVFEALPESYREGLAAPSRPGSPLVEVIEGCAQDLQVDTLLILDQFEEYFLYRPLHGDATDFPRELEEILSRSEFRARVLISIREDALGRLDDFRDHISELFGNCLRIDALDADAAREAVVEPLTVFNREFATRYAIEEPLIDAILKEVQVGGAALADFEFVPGELQPAHVEINAPYLQLVMTQLWERELINHSALLRLATFERLGGMPRIARRHLDEQLKKLSAGQLETAYGIFHYLVTPSGSKIAHTPHDLAMYSGSSEGETRDVLVALSRGEARILRVVAPPTTQPAAVRYEIFHDVLAGSIQEWCQRHLMEERNRYRKWRSLVYALLLVVVAFSARDLARHLSTTPLGRDRPHSRQTVIVTIGDDEFWRGDLAGRRPLKRSYLARLVQEIDNADPAVIALDFDLSDPFGAGIDYRAENLELSRAIRVASSKRDVVLPETLEFAGRQPKTVRSIFDGINLGPGVRWGHTLLAFDSSLLPAPVSLPNGRRLASLSSAIADATRKNADFLAGASEISFIRPFDFPSVRAGEILASDQESTRRLLAHRIAIVGAAFHVNGYGRGPVVDLQQTPVGPMLGVVLQANYVEAILDRRVMPRSSEALLFLELPLALLMAVASVAGARSRVGRVAAVAGIYALGVLLALLNLRFRYLAIDLVLLFLLLVVFVLVEWAVVGVRAIQSDLRRSAVQ